MQVTKKKLIAYLIIAFMVGVLATEGVGLLVKGGITGSVKVSKEEYDAMSTVYEKYGKLEQIYQTVDKYYYKDLEEQNLLDGAYKGLVAGLGDPYSSYMTATEYESWEAAATGEYSGVGITFSEDENGNYIVIDVAKDSPADKGGMKVGDYILEVDGKTYDDMEVMAVAIRGNAGTKVELTYVREGKEGKATFTREDIVQQSVEYEMLNGKIGYIRVSSFIDKTGEDFDKALQDLEKQRAKGLILDLRDNGGGLVDSAVDVADEFLDKGVVTYVEDRNGKRTEYDSKYGKTDLKTVVLVNGNSASSSEILAAALKDNGMKLVGEKTFGKGVIQSTAKLDDGSALKITIMQYFSPKGNVIHEKGIEPDYAVKNSEDSDVDAQLQKALELF